MSNVYQKYHFYWPDVPLYFDGSGTVRERDGVRDVSGYVAEWCRAERYGSSPCMCVVWHGTLAVSEMYYDATLEGRGVLLKKQIRKKTSRDAKHTLLGPPIPWSTSDHMWCSNIYDPRLHPPSHCVTATAKIIASRT
eukprot:PhF_6_TR33858/c0_g1_i1/m.49668